MIGVPMDYGTNTKRGGYGTKCNSLCRCCGAFRKLDIRCIDQGDIQLDHSKKEELINTS